MSTKKSLTERIDWALVSIYLLITLIGIFSIYSVEYRDTGVMAGNSYAKQAMWLGISIALGCVIMLTDSKLFISIPFGSYIVGIFLLLLVLVFHENVRGSKSFLPLGPLRFQPGELAKIFTSLALAKYLSAQATDFTHNRQNKYTAIGIILLPAILVILSNETGLALVYFSLFIMLYREGLSGSLFVIAGSFIALTVTTLLVDKNTLFIILTVVLFITFYLLRKQLRKSRELLIILFVIWGFCIAFSQLLIPTAFKHVLKPYQVDRIYTMLGADMPSEYAGQGSDGKKKGSSEYNVKQSKIAIGSGGFLGKGPLNGTQTAGNFVPEQTTDFIFCSVGEQFGLWGSVLLLALYALFILRIIFIAERQKSKFNRIYAYCIASITLFHLFVNIGMTIGLAPVIGIPLPMMSYGGTSLLTFSAFISILVKLDAER